MDQTAVIEAAAPARTRVAETTTAALLGVTGKIVKVEADLANGLPSFTIVGLPDKAVAESRERVRAAIKNSGVPFPVRKITVNLAPADLKKEGAAYDLAIAAAILSGAEVIPALPDGSLLVGELGLDGAVRGISGIVPMLIASKLSGLTTAFIPAGNLNEARLVTGLTLYPLERLEQLISHLLDEVTVSSVSGPLRHRAPEPYPIDFKDIKGQQRAKRALEIAAAGSHNVLFTGPPGSGKTLLARAFPSILPPLTDAEQLELTMIYSAAGLTTAERPIVSRRPFRHPHHTASDIALTGGGSTPKPGEVTLAHRGVLFLDEIAEFPTRVLEVLRQPLEDKSVTVARAAASYDFPADFRLLAAVNPCPCGNLGSPGKVCECPTGRREAYLRRLSGPLLDRIDLFVEFAPVNYEELTGDEPAEDSLTVRERVTGAFRQIEQPLSFEAIPDFVAAHFTPEARELLARAMNRLDISARGYHKLIRICRTIAALSGAADVSSAHLAEALTYRERSAR